MSDQVMERLRKEVEACDFFSGCILKHSLGGGTGSGLGSRILEEFREEYRKEYLASVCILPFKGGESPLQSYNALLSLAWLQESSNIIALH